MACRPRIRSASRCVAVSLVRHPVHHAEGAERVSLRRNERSAGVETDMQAAGDERIVCEAVVARGVGHHEHVGLENGVAAERLVAAGFRNRHAAVGL